MLNSEKIHKSDFLNKPLYQLYSMNQPHIQPIAQDTPSCKLIKTDFLVIIIYNSVGKKFRGGFKNKQKSRGKKNLQNKQNFFYQKEQSQTLVSQVFFFSLTFLKGTIWFSRMAVKVASVRI